MGNMKTPGVYIVEKNAFPNSVVEVETAIPAFIGYTQKAENGSESLLNKPFRIASMSEFETHFGGAPNPMYNLVEKTVSDSNLTYIYEGDKRKYYLVSLPVDKNKYTLYYNMYLFFANGGGSCFIVSVGNYESKLTVDAINAGINLLEEESEPTMLVVPDAVNINSYKDIHTAMLAHCAKKMNRISLLDFEGEGDKAVKSFHDGVGSSFLSYGAAYYPWLHTSVLTDRDVTYLNLDDASYDLIIKQYKAEHEGQSNLPEKPAPTASLEDKLTHHNLLYQNCSLYKLVLTEVRNQINLLPPSAAMAGIYTMVDNTRGVWKAPANVSVNQVVSVAVTVTHEDQEVLNVPMNGKSINVIRFFTGDGIKVWGARTLDGNSLDWRYVNVRRTMIFLEESVRNAARAYVFEPNVAAVWLSMKSMIENFLRGVWKRGGLAGASPEEAFSVHVGLGDTMTPEDILEGILRITVLVAISRPAEFIEITFQQQMQKS